jgi:hypothetical protein
MTLYDMMYYMMISKENTECLVSLYIYIYIVPYLCYKDTIDHV